MYYDRTDDHASEAAADRRDPEAPSLARALVRPGVIFLGAVAHLGADVALVAIDRARGWLRRREHERVTFVDGHASTVTSVSRGIEWAR